MREERLRMLRTLKGLLVLYAREWRREREEFIYEMNRKEAAESGDEQW